jgi:hypothetical protein
MRLITCECTCKANEPYVDGTMPEFYSEEKKAISKFLKYKQGLNGVYYGQAAVFHTPTLFFGVHINGKHILAVKDD